MKIKLNKNKKYLLACSYGPDSMALFDILYKNGYDFIVAHVNYNLREESKQEQMDLYNYCKNRKIPFFTMSNEEEILSNVEEKCRKIRYIFFKDVYFKNGCDALLVAHNQDDLIETYYLQKNRKSLVDFYGIKEKTIIEDMFVIRPLLDYSKESLLKYDNRNNVPYSIDKSNLTDKYERNKIRHHIVSKLDSSERTLILNEIMRLNIEQLSFRNKNLKSIRNDISDLLALNIKELAYFLNDLGRAYVSDLEISLKQIEEIRKLLLSDKPNLIMKFKDNLIFVKAYDKFYFTFAPKNTSYSFKVEKPGILDTDYFYLNFSKYSQNRNVHVFDYPLTIRNADPSDKIAINNYEVTARRLFIDWKMPEELRKKWPVILNCDNQIVYMPRYQKDFVIPDNCNFYVKL